MSYTGFSAKKFSPPLWRMRVAELAEAALAWRGSIIEGSLAVFLIFRNQMSALRRQNRTPSFAIIARALAS